MPESIIEKERQENQVNSYHKKSNRNNQQHKLLSRIAVPILFAALVGTTGGTIALASMIGGVSSMLFPSAEAAKKSPHVMD